MPISKLVWHRGDVPEELHGMLDTLGGEYPVTEGGRGLRLRFRKVTGKGILSRTIRSKGEVLVEYNTVAGAARGVGSAFSGVTGEEKTFADTFLHGVECITEIFGVGAGGDVGTDLALTLGKGAAAEAQLVE